MYFPSHLIPSLIFQKARLARIRIAKASSGAAFLNKKRAAEARLAAQESGIDMDDRFVLQHCHRDLIIFILIGFVATTMKTFLSCNITTCFNAWKRQL